jgi:hypothetical protein
MEGYVVCAIRADGNRDIAELAEWPRCGRDRRRAVRTYFPEERERHSLNARRAAGEVDVDRMS